MELNLENYNMWAIKRYNNPLCKSIEDFYIDIHRITSIKRLIYRYINKNELKERLILNHIITLSNVFLPEDVCKLLFVKLEIEFKYIKPFLAFLSICPDYITFINGKDVIYLDEYEMDVGIIFALRKI